MSLLKYFSKAPHGDVSEAAVSDHDASADLPSEAESDKSPSSLVTASGDTSESEFHSVVSGSSSLPEVSDSEDDPSLPLPPDPPRTWELRSHFAFVSNLILGPPPLHLL